MSNYRYKKSTLKWTPDGGSQASITGVQALPWGEAGTTTDLVADSDELIQELPVHDLKGRMTIELNDQSHWDDFEIGKGSITFQIEAVASGRGAASGGSVYSLTASNAVVVGRNADAQARPGGGLSVEIEIGDNGSGALFAWATVP